MLGVVESMRLDAAVDERLSSRCGLMPPSMRDCRACNSVGYAFLLLTTVLRARRLAAVDRLLMGGLPAFAFVFEVFLLSQRRAVFSPRIAASSTDLAKTQRLGRGEGAYL